MKNGLLSTRTSGSAVTFCLGGQISEEELPELSRHIETYLDARVTNIYIDLESVESLTPEALAFLVAHTDRVRTFGTKIWIQSLKEEITAMLDLGGTGRFLNMIKKQPSTS